MVTVTVKPSLNGVGHVALVSVNGVLASVTYETRMTVQRLGALVRMGSALAAGGYGEGQE